MAIAMAPLKIALFHNSPGYGNKRAIYSLARGLKARGHRIDAFVPETAEEEYLPLKSLGMDIKTFGPIRRPGPVDIKPYLLEGVVELFREMIYQRQTLHLNKRIAAEINASDYDVVYVDRCRAASSPFLLHYLKAPSVYYCHEPWREGYEDLNPGLPGNGSNGSSRFARFYKKLSRFGFEFKRRYLKRIDRNNARLARRLLTNSRYTSQYIRRVYGREASVSYLGVDASVFKPLGIGKERMVLSVGRLEPLKRHDLTIQAIGLIPMDRRPKFVMIADKKSARNRQELESLAKSLNVSMQILFNLSDDELAVWYNRAGVVAYASVNEPFGLVALEAMACGTPVVGVAEGGLKESIRDGVTGYLIDADPGSLARALNRVLGNAGLQKEMGEAGIRHVLENWTWDAAADRFEKHLHAAVEK